MKKHQTLIKVRYADIDMLHHVNNAKYLTYMETGRINYLIDVVGVDMNLSKKSVIMANAKIDFKAPIKLGDELIVNTRCCRIGEKSFDIEYKIVFKEYPEKEAAVGYTAMVAFDYEQNQTISIPENWKKRIKQYEEM